MINFKVTACKRSELVRAHAYGVRLRGRGNYRGSARRRALYHRRRSTACAALNYARSSPYVRFRLPGNVLGGGFATAKLCPRRPKLGGARYLRGPGQRSIGQNRAMPGTGVRETGCRPRGRGTLWRRTLHGLR